jgi:hypothetical protein
MSGGWEIKERERNKPASFRKEFPIQNDSGDDILESLQYPHDIRAVCKGTGIAYIQDLSSHSVLKLGNGNAIKYITVCFRSEFSSWFTGNP